MRIPRKPSKKMPFMEREDAEKYVRKFADEFTEFHALKANVAAINKMLLKRGRGDELFEALQEVIEGFKKKVNDGEKEEEKQEKQEQHDSVSEAKEEADCPQG